MGNFLFNRFGGNVMQNNMNNNFSNILSQLRQLQNNPGKILDILYQKGKINQMQYNDLQSIKNNPYEIVRYLSMHGNQNAINQASQDASQLKQY